MRKSFPYYFFLSGGTFVEPNVAQIKVGNTKKQINFIQ